MGGPTTTGLLRAGALPCLLALAAPAMAQEPGDGPRGFLLELTSPNAPLGGPPTATIVSADGERVDLGPKDDGLPPDASDGDEIYTAHVPAFTGASVELEVTAGESSWSTSIALDADRPFSRVTVELGTDGEATATPVAGGGIEGQPRPVADIPETAFAPRATESRSTPDRPAEKPANLWLGTGLWALLFAGLGITLALLPRWFGRQNAGPARLSPAPVEGSSAPVRIDRGQLEAALDGPLAGARLVVLGPLPDDLPASFRCEDRAPLPVELVAAVERLAATEGARPALLVSDPELLDRPGRDEPIDDLARRVAGRFPLWVVGGPASWDAWPGPEEDE